LTAEVSHLLGSFNQPPFFFRLTLYLTGRALIVIRCKGTQYVCTPLRLLIAMFQPRVAACKQGTPNGLPISHHHPRSGTSSTAAAGGWLITDAYRMVTNTCRLAHVECAWDVRQCAEQQQPGPTSCTTGWPRGLEGSLVGVQILEEFLGRREVTAGAGCSRRCRRSLGWGAAPRSRAPWSWLWSCSPLWPPGRRFQHRWSDIRHHRRSR
jgi:hypothetical protein